MLARKGMVHYRVETKQEAVRLVLEEHLRYANEHCANEREPDYS